jgi:hypothetical protein
MEKIRIRERDNHPGSAALKERTSKGFRLSLFSTVNDNGEESQSQFKRSSLLAVSTCAQNITGTVTWKLDLCFSNRWRREKTCNFPRLCPEIGHDIVQVQVQQKMILFPVKICAVIRCTIGYNHFDLFWEGEGRVLTFDGCKLNSWHL